MVAETSRGMVAMGVLWGSYVVNVPIDLCSITPPHLLPWLLAGGPHAAGLRGFSRSSKIPVGPGFPVPIYPFPPLQTATREAEHVLCQEGGTLVSGSISHPVQLRGLDLLGWLRG